MCVILHTSDTILMWTYSIPPLQAQLQLAVEQEDKFHQSYQSLDAGLGSMEETQETGGSGPPYQPLSSPPRFSRSS